MTDWTMSTGLSFSGSTLTSTGVTPAGGLVIAGSTDSGTTRAATIAASASDWQDLTPPPIGTSAVVATPAGSFEALTGKNSTLTVDTLTAGAWTRTQSLEVPIQYGSSG